MNKTWRNLAIVGLILGLGAAAYVVFTTKPTKKERRKISVTNTGA